LVDCFSGKHIREVAELNRITKTKTHLVVLSTLLMTVTAGSARTTTVGNDPSADFNSIQRAIDGANDGDVIIVAEARKTKVAR